MSSMIIVTLRAAALVATVIALAAPTPARTPAAPVVPDDRALSVGCWNVVAVDWDGTPVDAEFLKLLQVCYQADGSWAVLLRSRPVAEGRSTIRQHESPKTFEMETLGSERIQPSRYTGIYWLQGDIRVLCIVPAGSPRPTEFSAPRRSGRMLVTLRRSPP